MPGWPLPPGKPALYPASSAGFTAPTLEDWQYSYQGLTFGVGTEFDTVTVSGITGPPVINSKDQPFPRDTGEYPGEDSMGGRDITIDFQIKGGDNIGTKMLSLGSAFSAIPYLPQPLWFKVPDLEVMCSMCRPRQGGGDLDVNVTAGIQRKTAITLHANDPRLYGQAQTLTGLDGDTITVSNAGNCEVRPVILLPQSEAPKVTNTTIGSNAVTALNVLINDGDTIVVDLATPHTAVYWPGGIVTPTAPLYSIFNGIDRTRTTWWTLVPGDNHLSLSLSSSGGASAAIWWASAYMLL
jgi:hypothetical protein